MTKDTFKFAFNNKTEMWYVYKDQDELMKNHKNTDEKVTGFMPENRDDPLCPVKSFRKYLEHLHRENNYLWQTPLDKINLQTMTVWYGRQHMGKNTLANFMQDVSKECKLSKKYTNHSIRVTGVTVLTRQNFAAPEIMSITGHKSVQSLTRYQRTQDLQKITMGNVMHQALTRQEENIIVPRRAILMQNETPPFPQQGNVSFNITSPRRAMAPISFNEPIRPKKENVTNEIVPFEANFKEDSIPDFDLVSILNDVEKEEKTKNTTKPNQTAMVSTSQVVNNIPKSLFHNCTIQNITFNMK